MSDEDLKVADAMQKYGGSFVQSLAALMHQADAINLEKIKATWPEYYKKYADMAEEK